MNKMMNMPEIRLGIVAAEEQPYARPVPQRE